MKPIIMDIQEMSLSKEAYDSRPNAFFVIFIYGVFAMIAVALVWTYFGELEIVVKASGLIRPNMQTAVVVNAVAGEIKDVRFSDGQQVKQGEILYLVDSFQQESDKNAFEEHLGVLRHDLLSLNLYKESIETDRNLFSVYTDSSEERTRQDADNMHISDVGNEIMQAYSNRYLKYIVDRDYLRLQYHQQRREMDNNTEKARDDYRGYSMIKRAISNGDYSFSSGGYDIYKSRYDDYMLQVQQLTNEYLLLSDILEKNHILQENGAISVAEYNEMKKMSETAKFQLENYKSQFLHEIDTEIKVALERLSILEGSMPLNQKEMDNAIEKHRLDTLVSIDAQIKSSEQEILQCESSLKKIEAQIEASTVKAQIAGSINAHIELIKGSYLLSGVDVMTIIPVRGSVLSTYIYVSNNDIVGVEVGMPVNYNIYAMPRREYGVITGRITKISEDIRTDKTSSQGYYLIEADIEDKQYISAKGTLAELRVGMNVDVRIITGRKKILFYLLEQLDLMIH